MRGKSEVAKRSGVGPQARVLVVDDREGTARALKRILQKEGYEVLTAFDGETGLKRACEEIPDLIILDIMMPGMDGYDVCRRLHSCADTARIPVLVLTGRGRIDSPHIRGQLLQTRVREREKAFAAGATEFLSKPVRARDLLERVKALLWLGDI